MKLKHKTTTVGFSLLELVISIAISSILMTAALTIYNQIGKSATIIQKITTYDTKMMIMHDRLSKDLAGISHRWFAQNMYEELKKAKEQAPKKPEPKTQETKEAEPKNNDTKKADSKQKKENIFFAHNGQEGFDSLSFLTTGALQIYGETSSNLVRVVYKTVSDKHATANPKTLRLMRKQDNNASADIDKEKIKDGNFYELASGISKLTIEYGFTVPSPQEQEKNPEQKTSFKWIKQWSKDENDTKEYQPTTPEALKINIVFSQGENKPELSYEMICLLPPRDTEYPKSFAQKRQEAQKAKGAEPKDIEPKGEAQLSPKSKATTTSGPAPSNALQVHEVTMLASQSSGQPLSAHVTAGDQGATIISIGEAHA
jgi:prepilin-type N-terminal cleavage/methylation domain-containing protein